jgi:hypothetical protein|uniref:Uncharacterized protein n=1 Tax=Podoviridae sp. ctwJH20 TaxID=2827753 RepID=A0A8S5TD22_9CAUD|nr:MAG TPA: hypothetical protein [Podoviridae sp. ctwJH20]
MKPSFTERAAAFVIVCVGTAAAIFISTHLVTAGIGLFGRCA